LEARESGQIRTLPRKKSIARDLAIDPDARVTRKNGGTYPATQACGRPYLVLVLRGEHGGRVRLRRALCALSRSAANAKRVELRIDDFAVARKFSEVINFTRLTRQFSGFPD
jgi:hypothetical protein